ncbi:MAG TPA: LacI family DNA-binding transcriptional regulator, partial [Clostridia bacterium]|nr:LacI family DNA-binding transcriptional regulator [Clostridia bacterium]
MSRTHSSRVGSAVTMKDVAAEAGVSIATISRVLSGRNGVTKPVRERVLRTIGKLDYHPNRLARGLRAGRRKLVGVVIPDLQNPFFPGVVHGVEEILYAAGYTLVLGHSDGLVERERNHLMVLRGEGAAGLILIPDNGTNANYEFLRAQDVAVVAVDRVPTGLQVDLVTSSNREGMRAATTHLLGHGYRSIGFINGPEHVSVARERLAGYREGLLAAGLEYSAVMVIHSDFRQAGGHLAMASLLDQPNPPRAVLIGNNLMTLGALQAIHERGLKIPDQVAVVGFDDMSWAASLNPPLTAIAQPAEEIGRTAAQMLLERLTNPGRLVRQVVLPTRLIVR